VCRDADRSRRRGEGARPIGRICRVERYAGSRIGAGGGGGGRRPISRICRGERCAGGRVGSRGGEEREGG